MCFVQVLLSIKSKIMHLILTTILVLILQGSTWYRKATPCGFHFLPVPVDPFALPTAPDSDPLRGPIIVPLNISCMSDGNKTIFHGEIRC